MPELETASLTPTGLNERDIHILNFEREWTRHDGAKEEAISSQFQVSTARYYQMLNAVIDTPDAAKHDPMLVSRLQRNRHNLILRRPHGTAKNHHEE